MECHTACGPCSTISPRRDNERSEILHWENYLLLCDESEKEDQRLIISFVEVCKRKDVKVIANKSEVVVFRGEDLSVC